MTDFVYLLVDTLELPAGFRPRLYEFGGERVEVVEGDLLFGSARFRYCTAPDHIVSCWPWPADEVSLQCEMPEEEVERWLTSDSVAQVGRDFREAFARLARYSPGFCVVVELSNGTGRHTARVDPEALGQAVEQALRDAEFALLVVLPLLDRPAAQ